MNDFVLFAVIGIGAYLLWKQNQANTTAPAATPLTPTPTAPVLSAGTQGPISPQTGNPVVILPTVPIPASTPVSQLPIPAPQFAPTYSGGTQAEVQLPAPGSNPLPISQWLIPAGSIQFVDPNSQYGTTLNYIYNALRVYGQGNQQDARQWDTWLMAVYNIPQANPPFITGTVDLDTYFAAAVPYIRTTMTQQAQATSAAIQQQMQAAAMQQPNYSMFGVRGSNAGYQT